MIRDRKERQPEGGAKLPVTGHEGLESRKLLRPEDSEVKKAEAFQDLRKQIRMRDRQAH
jgi:hypothetical protein